MQESRLILPLHQTEECSPHRLECLYTALHGEQLPGIPRRHASVIGANCGASQRGVVQSLKYRPVTGAAGSSPVHPPVSEQGFWPHDVWK